MIYGPAQILGRHGSLGLGKPLPWAVPGLRKYESMLRSVAGHNTVMVLDVSTVYRYTEPCISVFTV